MLRVRLKSEKQSDEPYCKYFLELESVNSKLGVFLHFYIVYQSGALY